MHDVSIIELLHGCWILWRCESSGLKSVEVIERNEITFEYKIVVLALKAQLLGPEKLSIICHHLASQLLEPWYLSICFIYQVNAGVHVY